MKVVVELADDEVLVALKRVEGYEDVHPEILTDDAIGDSWPEWRTIHGDQVVPASTRIELAQAERIEELETLLKEIGNYAHDHSTGPAVPDALWTIREMAYDG